MRDETPAARELVTVGLPLRSADEEDWATILAATECSPTRVALPTTAEPVQVRTFLRTETRWTGDLPATHNAVPNKPLFDLDGSPWCAEFVILRLLERAGWRGVWVKNFRGPREFWTEPRIPLALPASQAALFATLERAMGAANQIRNGNGKSAAAGLGCAATGA
jgi:hypothetical protein